MGRDRSILKAVCNRRLFAGMMGVILGLIFFQPSAWAHKVTIFAWVEGDTVHTQSKFSGGKRAKNATVVVEDKEGNQLLEGVTDENGEFSFKIPKKTDLKIILKASMGHLGDWTIPVEQLTGEGAASEPTGGQESGEEVVVKDGPDEQEGQAGQGQAPVQTASGLSREEVRNLIDAALDKKLAPIVNMLVDSQEEGPTMEEVIGGVGYIFGLVGVAMYFSSRRKSK
jgi:nickel transport protein